MIDWLYKDVPDLKTRLDYSYYDVVNFVFVFLPTKLSRKNLEASVVREHSHMTSDFFGVFLTYLLTLIRYILYYISLFSKVRFNLSGEWSIPLIPEYLEIVMNEL